MKVPLNIFIFAMVVIFAVVACTTETQPSIPHIVLLDTDLNQSQDSTDIPLANITVKLYEQTDEEAVLLEESTTNEEGIALFSKLPENSSFTYDMPASQGEARTLACIVQENTSLCEIVVLTDTSKVASFSDISSFNQLAIAESTYLIRNVNSGMCVDVSQDGGKGHSDGANIYQYPCHGRTNQQWTLQALGNNTFSLESVNSGLMMEVSGASKKQGATIHQWHWNNTNNQKWVISQNSNGSFALKAVHSNMCLDVSRVSKASRADIYQWTCHGRANQQFEFVKLDGSTVTIPNLQLIKNGIYSMTSVHSNKVVDVAGFSTESGANIHQWNWNNTLNQKWTFQHLGDDVYRIDSLNSGKSLSIASASGENGTNVIQLDWTGSQNQQWKVTKKGDAFEFKALSTEKCLDVKGYSQDNGGNLYSWRCHNGNNQRWTVGNFEAGQLILDGTYMMTAVHSNKCVDVARYSTAPGGTIHQWRCTGTTNQQWRFEHLGNNQYQIFAASSDLSLAVSSNSTADGTDVIQDTVSNDNRQKWKVVSKGDAFELQAVSSNKCLDVAANSQIDGGNVQQSTCDGGTNQHFRFKSVANIKPPSTGGQWSAVQEWPVIATSMVNLKDGRILAWAALSDDSFKGSSAPNQLYSEAVIYNPTNNTFVEADNPTHDMFCAGMVMLPDGTHLSTGGGNGSINNKRVSIFNQTTQKWSQQADMANPHWYGTSVAMANGDVFTSLGRSSGNKSEILRGGLGGQWVNLPDVNLTGLDAGLETPDWYPYMHLSPRGTIFHSGGTGTMHEISVSGNGSTTNKGIRTGDNVYRQWANAIMIDEGKIMLTGGTPKQGSNSSLASGVMIDINNANPNVTKIADMNYSRTFHTTIPLPNGEVFVAGGNGNGFEFNDGESRLIPEIYNPETNTWRDQAAMEIPRNYHSSGILLQDGRILMAGGGLCAPCDANHQDGQIFSPPYLFNQNGTLASRPTISSAPTSIDTNQSFNVRISGAQNISSFYLIKHSAVTHAMNTDLRRLKVSVSSKNGSTYTLKSHANKNVLTPGYYFLFATNSDGVPSVAKNILVK